MIKIMVIFMSIRKFIIVIYLHNNITHGTVIATGV